jgi:hypothetical protein
LVYFQHATCTPLLISQRIRALRIKASKQIREQKEYQTGKA